MKATYFVAAITRPPPGLEAGRGGGCGAVRHDNDNDNDDFIQHLHRIRPNQPISKEDW